MHSCTGGFNLISMHHFPLFSVTDFAIILHSIFMQVKDCFYRFPFS